MTKYYKGAYYRGDGSTFDNREVSVSRSNSGVRITLWVNGDATGITLSADDAISLATQALEMAQRIKGA